MDLSLEGAVGLDFGRGRGQPRLGAAHANTWGMKSCVCNGNDGQLSVAGAEGMGHRPCTQMPETLELWGW